MSNFITKRLLILATLILLHISYVYSQDTDTLNEHQPLERYQALLWEITIPDNPHTSYIYGALETNQKLAFHLIDSFFTALKSSSRILLELHPDSTAKALRDPDILKRVYKNFYNTSYKPSGNYYSLLHTSSFDSDLLEMLLGGGFSRFNMSDDMEEEKSLIDFVFTTALKTNKQVAGLVNYEEYLDQSEKAEKFVKEANKRKKNVREDYQEQYLLYQKAFDAYRRGDLGELDTIFRKMVNIPGLFTEILDPFYEKMASRMADHMREASCFIMMDATAMGGDIGIIEKLRRKGYQLKPVNHYILTKPNKEKEKIDRMTTRVKTTIYTPPSGAWSVKVPEYTIGSAAEQSGQSMFYDRLNDIIYSVNRYPTFANLSFQTPEYIFERLDSVLFEYVPGKIIKRTDHQVAGYPAIDLTNRTSRGDLEKSRIIITPLEIIVFKISGQRNLIKKGNLGKKFIASTSINTRDNSQWKEVSTGHGEFSLSLPPYYLADTTSNVVFVGTNMVYQAWDPSTSSYFLFRRNIHHDLNLLEEDTFDLNFMAETMAEKMKMDIEKEIPGHHQGFPSLNFKLKEKEGDNILRGKIIMRGAVHYLLLTTSSDEKQANQYFEQFIIKPFEYSLASDTIQDTVLLYSVVSPISKQEKDDNDDLSEYYDYMEGEDVDDEAEKKEKLLNAYLPDHQKATYFFDLGAEYVEVMKFKQNDFKGFVYFNDLFNYWKSQENPSKEYILMDERQDSLAPFPYLEIILGDTNTTRRIHKKLILHHGLTYTLSTMNDTLEKMGLFTQQFFDTFTPFKDTLTGRPVMEDKGSFWISRFLSEDTIHVKQAIINIPHITFREHHKDSLFYILQSKDLMLRNINVSTRLIESYGRLQGDDIPGQLYRMYNAYADHPDIQISIFRALAFHQGVEARKMMLRILKTDIPLPAYRSKINSLVNPLLKFEDQLKILYPEIVQYERYPEYSKWVLALSVTLADRGVIKPDQHPWVVELISERIKEELKRRRAVDIIDKASKDPSKEEYSVFYDYEDIEEAIEYDYEEIWYNDIYDYSDPDDFTANENDKGEKGEEEFNIMDNSELILMVRFLSHSHQQRDFLPIYYEKILKGKNRTDAMTLAIFMLENEQKVHDSIWKNFARNPESRVDLYRRLQAVGKAEYFDSTWLHQQSFAESFIHIRKNIKDEDSLTFITRRRIQTPQKSGYIYFFKNKSGYGSNKDWHLSVVGIQPTDTTTICPKPDFVRFDVEQLYDNDDIEEIIDEQMKEFRKMHRKRFDNEDYYNYEEEVYFGY